MSERPNALLTNSQRQRISPDEPDEYSRQYRQRIRERVGAGVEDLALLFQHMEERDIEQVFKPDREAVEHSLELLEKATRLLRSRRSYREFHALFDLLTDLEEVTTRTTDLQAELSEVEQEQASLEKEYGSSSADDRDWELRDRLDTLEETRDDIESRLRESELEREELREEIEELLHEVRDDLKEQVERYDRALELAEQIPVQKLSEKRAEMIKRAVEALRESQRELEPAVHDFDNLVDTNDRDEMWVSELLSMEGVLREHYLTRSRKARSSKGGRHNDVGRLLADVRDDIKEELHRPEFDPEMRDAVVGGLAFLMRVSDVLGTDTEALVEDALVEMYEQEHNDEVVGEALALIETQPAEEAAMAGGEKDPDERLSNTELRALAEQNPRVLIERYRDTVEVSESALQDRVLSEPEILGDGVEIVDAEPRNAGDGGRVPDLVAKDHGGRTLVVEFKSTSRALEGVGREFQALIDEYGGAERVKGVLAVPSDLEDDATAELQGTGVRVVPVQIR